MRRALLLLLTAASALNAFRTDYSLAKSDQNKNPDLYFQFELACVSGGVTYWDDDHAKPFESMIAAYGPYVGIEFHHFRAGFSLLEAGSFPSFSSLPLSIGYTIYEKPVRHWGRLYSKEPEVYLKATGRFANGFDPPPYIPFIGTLEAVCSGSYVGVGLSATAGIGYAVDEGYPNIVPRKRYVYPFLALQVHLPLLLVGF